MKRREVVVRETHRALLFRNGALVDLLEPGRYRLTPAWQVRWLRRPIEDVLLLDVRERELTIKGQEILTADKVAIRVSIITNYRVVDPRAAVTRVERFEDRIYSDVQLAARRSLATMTLEDILTNRNQLSDDILQDVSEVAADYGVRFIYSIGKSLGDYVDLSLRLSYQLRAIDHGGFGVGVANSFHW